MATNGAYGQLRLVASRVDPRITLAAAVVARKQLLTELQSTGELGDQKRLPVPCRCRVPALPRRIGLVVADEGQGEPTHCRFWSPRRSPSRSWTNRRP